jgi:carboxyl-terminal processing protease
VLPAAIRGGGLCFCVIDVCLTPMPPPVPPAPIPYVNGGVHVMAILFVPNVTMTGMNVLTVMSIIPLTMGDEPGVANPNFMQAARFTIGNPTVRAAFFAVVSLLCLTTGNNGNAPVGMVVIAGALTVLLAYAPGGDEAAALVPAKDPADRRALGPADVDALHRALASVGRPDGPPVEARMIEPGVGGLAIRVFSADVPARVFSAVRDLSAQGMRAMVIDLRDNPGGEVTAFVELASDFLEEGSVVATMFDAEGDATVFRTYREQAYRFPVTLLVNARTASAAELFAGSLKAHGRARVVGETTYGKGLGQTMLTDEDGVTRATAVARYRMPDGSEVHGVGVSPG